MHISGERRRTKPDRQNDHSHMSDSEWACARRRYRTANFKLTIFWIIFTVWLVCILVGVGLVVSATLGGSDNNGLGTAGALLAGLPVLLVITIANYYPAFPWKLRLGPRWVRVIIWGLLAVGLIACSVLIVRVLCLERPVPSS